MSETIRESTRKRARRIESIVDSGGSVSARYSRPVIHYIVARASQESEIGAEAAWKISEEIKKRGLDLKTAWNLFDYYRVRMYPMYSFLLRLQDNAL